MFGATLTQDQLNGIAPIPITDPVYGTTQMLYRDPNSGTMLPLGESISPTGQYSCDTSNPDSQCYNLPGSPAGWSGPSKPVPFIGGAKGEGAYFDQTSQTAQPSSPSISTAPNIPIPAPTYVPTASQGAVQSLPVTTTTNSGTPLPSTDFLSMLEQPTSILGLNPLELIGIAIFGVILVKAMSSGGGRR